MTVEEKEIKEALGQHIRRVKFWLRPLPRRANIHRYPILNRFAEGAKKRAYLWSFRLENAIPAIYAGCIVTLMPLYGAQIIISLAFAILLRANLPILASLQAISNPITVWPIWIAGYQTGRSCLGLLGIETTPLRKDEIRTLLDNFYGGAWGENFERIASVFGITSLGGLILGTFFGLIGSTAYRIIANRTDASYRLLKEKLHNHRMKRQGSTPESPQNPHDYEI